MASIYCADVYCDDCIEDIKRRICSELQDGNNDSCMVEFLHNPGFMSIDLILETLDYVGEQNYDSAQYPKGCDDNEESDCPQHCGSHADCLNPEVLSDGTKVGHFFENELTSVGDDYVKETVNGDLADGEDSVAVELWKPCYDYLEYYEECEECGEYGNLEDDRCVDCTIQPEDGDYVIAPTGPLGSETVLSIVGRSCIGVFDSDDEAVSAARAKMNKDLFWPNIWYYSDHGNMTLWED